MIQPGDLDGDRDLDLAVAFTFSDEVSILLNNGDGTFAPDVFYSAGDGPRAVAMGDLDGDLDLDLAVTNQGGNDVSILLNNGDGTFASQRRFAAGPVAVVLRWRCGDASLFLQGS